MAQDLQLDTRVILNQGNDNLSYKPGSACIRRNSTALRQMCRETGHLLMEADRQRWPTQQATRMNDVLEDPACYHHPPL
ncbi:hypothetical protein CBOM_07612 [Ceraceosorus bombacis]|uniref:Uncharacterized protein n=1 Tax=Ceraceosorus bombacis TaxID=401625 RepID=A0A0P1BHL1_9BASI|nr:hypothetical protein CBOM_07612 [Ceraceosorus bombacis]